MKFKLGNWFHMSIRTDGSVLPVKLTLYRTDGLPIRPIHLEAYKADTRTAFDALEAELGKCTPDNVQTFQERLQALEDELFRKYPKNEEVELTDLFQLLDKLKQYNGFFLSVDENGGLVAGVV